MKKVYIYALYLVLAVSIGASLVEFISAIDALINSKPFKIFFDFIKSGSTHAIVAYLCVKELIHKGEKFFEVEIISKEETI